MRLAPRLPLAFALAGCAGTPRGGDPRISASPVAPGCRPQALADAIAAAPLRGRLGRLGRARLVRGGAAIVGDGAAADATVPVLAQAEDEVRIAVAGDGATLLVWVPRAELAPVAMSAARVSSTPGAAPRADGLGVTIYPGYPVDGEPRRGWVHVHGRAHLDFEGWVPDDTALVWAPDPPVAPPAGSAVDIAAGSAFVAEPDGTGAVLARARTPARGHLLESNPLGADKVEMVTDDVRVVGYAARPPLLRRSAPADRDLTLRGAPSAAPARCLYAAPGAAVIGVTAPGQALDLAPDGAGWARAPLATPWGEVVVAVQVDP